MIKNKNGITLLSLVVTIAVLGIIAGIAINSGREIVEKAKLNELTTNMLLIQAKSKEYITNVNFKIGIKPEEKTDEQKEKIRNEVYGTESEEGAKLQKANSYEIPTKFGISDTSTCYWLTSETQQKWGLEKIKLDTEKNEKYLIKFDEANETVEVYNTLGYKNKYSLTELKELENE